jgi:WD40 repeat protein
MNSAELAKFLHDAKRFILNCHAIVDSSPLQLYSSALVFAPEKCAIRDAFQHYMPSWICQLPNVDAHWGAVLQTLQGHSGCVRSVAFSGDGKTLASGSDDRTIKIWNATTGRELQTLQGHSDWVRSVAFSGDGKTLASGSDDSTITV